MSPDDTTPQGRRQDLDTAFADYVHTVATAGPPDWFRPMSPVLRTFVLATIAVPIVIYGLMPQLHKVRARLVSWPAAR